MNFTRTPKKEKEMKSYLRFLGRNKLYTAIEVVGLSIALAFVLLIGTYVWQQYDAIHGVEGFERTYSVCRNRNGEIYHGLHYSGARILKDNIPEIEQACRFYDTYDAPISIRQEKVQAKIISVDKEFFEMFGCKFIIGSASVFDDINNIVVCKSFADSYGGPEEVMGMMVDENIVAGVVEDFGRSLIGHCDIIQNIRLRGESIPHYLQDTYTFIRLKRETEIEDVQEKIKEEVQKIYDMSPFKLIDEPEIMSYEEAYFAPSLDFNDSLNNSDRRNLHIMTFVAILLLFSALVNFINLSSAMAGKRMKEMAARMVTGADRGMIFRKYILESIYMCLFCMTAGVMLAVMLEPYMNNVIQSDIPIRISLSPLCIFLYIISAAIIGLCSCIPSAMIGISASPTDVFKGKFRAENKMIFSKIFIMFQNAFSVILIAVAITMNMQMKHLAERPVGANIDNLYYLWLDNIYARGPLEEELRKMPFITDIGLSEGYPGGTQATGIQSENRMQWIGAILCDTKAFEMYDFRIRSEVGGETGGSVWIDQHTFNSMKSVDKSPDGEMKNIWFVSPDSRYGGIVEEFALTDALNINEDMWCWISVMETDSYKPFLTEGSALLIKTTGDQNYNRKAIIDIHRKYQEETDGIYVEPLDSGYISDLIAGKLTDVRNRTALMNIFMFLSLLLSAMGLVAMSSYYSSENVGDIAIRKVYGSTVGKETTESVWKYMRIVLLSCLIAIPVAIFASERYLEGFVYRINNHWWIYALSVILSILISLSAIFAQTLRAARTNPAEALKKE